MKNMKLYLIPLSLLCFASCKKYLDEKPSTNLAIPTTLEDAQSLIDYYPRINNVDPAAGEASADDYYLTDADWSVLDENSRRMYTWEKDFLFPPTLNDWSAVYANVYIANTAMEVLDKIPKTETNEFSWNDVYGQAHFIRGRSFLNAVASWSKAYNENNATSDMGIPLRLTSDFNIPSTRSTVRETYERIIADLKLAARLLPVTPVHKMRASKPAAYGLLARTYLWMRKYQEAGLYADSCLQLYNTLIDYNTVSATPAYPFSAFNAEDIFHSRGSAPPVSNNIAKVDSTLMLTYAANDLRKSLFFKVNPNGTYAYRGSYDGIASVYTGVSTNEIYLVRAEANARQGKTKEAIDDLNTLLLKRWKTGTYIPLSAATPQQALAMILQERRKELIMHGLRWMDIKRLNEEGVNITLVRKINGQQYQLMPGDLRFALPIPEDVIVISGLAQNPR
jgi:starch-binding outer membrane protein, SusD/RagB family